MASFISVISALAVPTTVAARDVSTKKLINLWLDANTTCRGSTSEWESRSGCNQRDVYDALLAARGWYYGKRDEYGYQMKWHPCGRNSLGN